MGDSVKLTDSDKAKCKEANEALLSSLKNEETKVKEDKIGFDTVLLAVTKANPGEQDDENEDEKDDNEEKNDKNDKNKKKKKSIWKSFIEAAKKIGEWAEDFVKALKNAPISTDLKKKITNICKTYFNLLKTTSLKLQAYRIDVNKMLVTLSTIIEIFVPPDEIKTELSQLGSEDEKIKKINEFAKGNVDELKKRLQNLSEQLQDNKNLKDLENLQTDWSDLSKDIEKILQEVDEELKELKRRLCIFLGVIAVILAVVIVAVGIASGGTAFAAIAPIIGTTSAWVAGGLAVLTVIGLAAFGIWLIAEPKAAEMLRLQNNTTLQTINNGLRNIAEQAQKMQEMLHFIYKDWLELKNNDPNDVLSVVWGKINVKDMIVALNLTKTNLQELIKSIKETEEVCDTEIANFSEKVYKPLLELYGA